MSAGSWQFPDFDGSAGFIDRVAFQQRCRFFKAGGVDADEAVDVSGDFGRDAVLDEAFAVADDRATAQMAGLAKLFEVSLLFVF